MMKDFLEDENLIKLSIFDILLTEHGFNVILQSEGYLDRALQILVGFADAQLLTIQFNKVRTTKPLFVDILVSILDMLQVSAKAMNIYNIEDNQFSTRLYLEGASKQRLIVETKTSDALAIMLATQGTIYIKKEIFISKSTDYNFFEDRGEEETQQYRFIKMKELRDKLELAISEEKYEEAISLRDEMKKLQGESDV